MIEAESLYPNLPAQGSMFRTKTADKLHTSEDAQGFLVKQKHIDCRRPNVNVKYIGWVPGCGGDVWWGQHDDGSIGAYSIRELLKLEPSDEGFVEVA